MRITMPSVSSLFLQFFFGSRSVYRHHQPRVRALFSPTMAPTKKSSTLSTLGKAIIRSRFAGSRRPTDDTTQIPTFQHYEEAATLSSITQENDLDAFLRTAELAGTEFTAERLNVQVIGEAATGESGVPINPYLLSAEEERAMRRKIREHQDKLRIPRRPAWTRDMQRHDLDANERAAFLEWRRDLAILEEDLEMVMTPFERNLEVWRQLWRVIERSDVVVQIVDARNPLFFRCDDVDHYVKEVDASKTSLLLINKSDYLTEGQRQAWALYLGERGIPFLFFSAAEENERMEEMKAAEKVEGEGENDESGGEDVDEVTGEEVADEEDAGEEDAGEEVADEVVVAQEGKPEITPTSVLSCTDLYDYFCTLVPAGKETITVGLVGYPNVGKSSTINALIGAKKVNVSATPGKTKHFQTIVLSPQVTLCDCPGLVFPSFAATKAEMVVNGVLPIDQLREYTGPCTLVARWIPREYVEWVYGVKMPMPGEGQDPERPPTSSEMLCTYAVARGFRKAGQGNPDEARAARHVLKDFVAGKLLYCHAPPTFSLAEARTYNDVIYAEGGSKFIDRTGHGSAMATNPSMARDALTSIAANTGKMTAMQMDGDFFADRTGGVRARTVGKFQDVDFRRVNVYPHQSAYVLEQDAIGGSSIGGGAPTVAASMASRLADGSRGKKSHKLGKQRVKDRSWRAE